MPASSDSTRNRKLQPLGPSRTKIQATACGVASAHNQTHISCSLQIYLELLSEPVDVALGGIARMRPGVDGVLLGGQSKRVPTHRVQHVEASHALLVVCCVSSRRAHRLNEPHTHLVASQNVRGGVALWVADVQARAAAQPGKMRQLDAKQFRALLPRLGYGNMSRA